MAMLSMGALLIHDARIDVVLDWVLMVEAALVSFLVSVGLAWLGLRGFFRMMPFKQRVAPRTAEVRKLASV